VDARVLRAERFVEIGNVLERDAELMIERWSRRAAFEQPKAQRVHQAALRDDLPNFLRALGRRLKTATGDEGHAEQHSLVAANHGEQRWESGWSLPEVVHDYQILRLVILDYLEEVLRRPLTSHETMAIGLGLDEAIAASVTTYVKSRDLYQSMMEAERIEQFQRLQEQLRQHAEVMVEADRRKNEFLATLGHELRNPLAPLGNAVRVLELHELADPQLIQARGIIKRQVQQMGRLVDDLLDISSIARSKIELRKEHVDLATIMSQAAQMSGPHLQARHHQFEVALPAEPLWVEGDRTRLVQVIVNLLNNAAKYTEPGGRVWLSAGREGAAAVVRVRDSGRGISPETLPFVFDLDQPGRGARPADGMGIGLALVRRLVELHGGTITAHSAGVGQGSEFVLRLAALASPPQAQGRAAEIGTPAPREAKLRILVVDDNVDAADTLGILLQAMGHELRLAYDGPGALRAAADFRPDVVLLDIGMPGMDGYEVARRLRALPGLEKVMLVALTGYGQEEDRQRSEQFGFNTHLLKPVDLDELQSVLTRHWQESHKLSSASA